MTSAITFQLRLQTTRRAMSATIGMLPLPPPSHAASAAVISWLIITVLPSGLSVT